MVCGIPMLWSFMLAMGHVAVAVDLNFKLNFYHGETGYYEVEGFNTVYPGVQPTLHFSVGVEYHLYQTHITNWMHPLGLAYQPDGAHDVLYPGGDGAPEVTDGSETGYEFIYYVKYPNQTDFTAVSLDVYEPLFFYPIWEWVRYEFKVMVKIIDASFASSIVYFCHIHNTMSGLIEILGGTGSSVQQLYEPVVPSAFDAKCGTFDAAAYQSACEGQIFLCGEGLGTTFAECMEAIDCKMYQNMQTMHVESDYVTTFIHQMIPHHQNAVNMARILLKLSSTYGDGTLGVDIADPSGNHDGFEDILLSMVNTQNYQISEMRKWLLENEKRRESNCSSHMSGQRRLATESIAGLQTLKSTSIENANADTSGEAEQRSLVEATEGQVANTGGNTFVFTVDLYTYATGYYKVHGYEGVSPNITMELGTTYTFDQFDITNWYHPVGIAYQPDGFHNTAYPGGQGAPELLDGMQAGYAFKHLVKYPGEADFMEVTLQEYEKLFFYPISEFIEYKFKVELTITDANVASSLVYFCRIHDRMSGLITVAGGTGSSVANLYEPHQPGEFDSECGTFVAGAYSGDNQDAYCPNLVFLCGATSNDFVECMTAIDCKMTYEMSVANIEANPVATFMHQMIPHHANAVNMARILLKKSPTFGDGSLQEDIAGEKLEHMLLDMVGTQNAQITRMMRWLGANSFPITGTRCGVPTVTTTDQVRGVPTSTTTDQMYANNSMMRRPCIFMMLVLLRFLLLS